MTTSTQKGEAQTDTIDSPIDESDAAEILLKRFLPPDDAAKQPSEDNEEDERNTNDTEGDESSEETPEGEEQSDEEGDEADDDEKPSKKYASDDDDTYVKITVDDEEHEVSVKALKRLYGQEASLTRKSQEVAEVRKGYEQAVERNVAASSALLERAKQRWEPYSKIDFNLAAAQLSAEEYTALRQEAVRAYEDVEFYTTQLDGFHKAISDRRQAEIVERARQSLAVLTGPAEKGGIEGFNDKVFSEIRQFAIDNGVPKETMDQLVDSWAIRMLHSAMLYERGKAKASTTTSVVRKVNKTPTRVVKTSQAPRDNTSTTPAQNRAAVKKASSKLAHSGTTDDAAEVMLARWATSDE